MSHYMINCSNVTVLELDGVTVKTLDLGQVAFR